MDPIRRQLRAGVLALAVAAACGRAEAGPPRAAATASARTVVDSILPMDEEIRRFRATAPGDPAGLEQGERSADALVRRWVRAVETADTADLGRMHLSPAEFITLYFPESRYLDGPYRQSPRLFWFLLTNRSSQGLTRVLRRHGGAPLGFVGYRCAGDPEVAGRNRVWGRCVIERDVEGTRADFRFFGAIIEREGRYKFFSYASGY